MGGMGHDQAWWRGTLTCVRAAAMLDAAVGLLAAGPYPYLAPALRLSQGSYRPRTDYSGTTHCGCGVNDVSRWVSGRLVTGPEWSEIVRCLRRVGFAAWHRTEAQGDWPEHTHMVAVGCPELSDSARAQVVDYLAGRNGLVNRGRDDGPRDWVGVTWEDYTPTPVRAPVATTQEDDMAGRLVQVGGEAAIWYACPETGAWWQVPDIEWIGNALPGTVESVNARQRDLIRDSCARTAVAVNPATAAVVATIDPAAIAAAIPADLARQVADELARRLAA